MRPTSLLLPASFLLVAGLSVFAWHEHSALVQLRGATLDQPDRAAFDAKLADAERRNRELEALVAALKDRTTAAPEPAAPSAEADGSSAANAILTALAQMDNGEAGNDAKRDAALELLGALADMPEFQKLLALQRRGAVDMKYAALFKKLHLAPEQQQQLERLLADKQTAFVDALVAARDQGLTGKEARTLANSVARATQKDIDTSIKSLLGDQGYDKYRSFERTQPQRETVEQLAQRLSYTPNPLTLKQQEQLVQTMVSTSRQDAQAAKAAAAPGQKAVRPADTVPSLPGALGNQAAGSAGTAVITTSAMKNADAYLSDAQMSVLKQMQQEQQAQLALSKLLRGGGVKKPAKPGKG